MLTALLLAVIVLLVALARGGSLDSLAATKLRWPGLVIVGLGLQVGSEVWSPPWLTDALWITVLAVSDVLVAIFIVANWRTPGIVLAGMGLILNALVIGANGAMPVSRDAAVIAGVESLLENPGLKHELMDGSTALPYLGDVIPIPFLPEVLSIGDVFLALGIAQLVYTQTTARRRKERREGSVTQ